MLNMKDKLKEIGNGVGWDWKQEILCFSCFENGLCESNFRLGHKVNKSSLSHRAAAFPSKAAIS